MKRILLAGLFGSLVLLVLPTPVAAQCGIPGQYLAADGTCQCPEGYYHDRGTVACEQIECPQGAGRTYTLECACPEGTVPETTQMTTETGLGYTLISACVPPGSSTAGLGEGVVNSFLPSTWFGLPSVGQRWRDGWDSMTNGTGVERLVGAVSLVGMPAEAIAWLGLTGIAATWATGKAAGLWAARQAAGAARAAAGALAARAGAAEMGQIASVSRAPLLSLIQKMKQAGIAINPDNILRLINEARLAQGLAPWGRSSLEIIRRGVGLLK